MSIFEAQSPNAANCCSAIWDPQLDLDAHYSAFRKLAAREGLTTRPICGDRIHPDFGDEADRLFDWLNGRELVVINIFESKETAVDIRQARMEDGPVHQFTVVRSKAELAKLDGRYWFGLMATFGLDIAVLESDEFHLAAAADEVLNRIWPVEQCLREWTEYVEGYEAPFRREARQWVNRLLTENGMPSI